MTKIFGQVGATGVHASSTTKTDVPRYARGRVLFTSITQKNAMELINTVFKMKTKNAMRVNAKVGYFY